VPYKVRKQNRRQMAFCTIRNFNKSTYPKLKLMYTFQALIESKISNPTKHNCIVQLLCTDCIQRCLTVLIRSSIIYIYLDLNLSRNFMFSVRVSVNQKPGRSCYHPVIFGQMPVLVDVN